MHAHVFINPNDYVIHSQEYADKNGLTLIETSAKENTNVEMAFLTLVAELEQTR